MTIELLLVYVAICMFSLLCTGFTCTTHFQTDRLDVPAKPTAILFVLVIDHLMGRDTVVGNPLVATQHPNDDVRQTLLWLCACEEKNYIVIIYCLYMIISLTITLCQLQQGCQE